jgi:uncharacterized damage-inducible protein DinB
MAFKEALLAEFDHEMGSTRRLLERVPDGKLGWKPHDKSYSLGDLSGHIATLSTWMNRILESNELDLASIADTRPASPASRDDVLQRLETNAKSARATLAEQTDASLLAAWTLKNGGREVFTMPRSSVLRSFVFNHLIHHRGQLTVYLRLQNVPLPSLYGPTADEP